MNPLKTLSLAAILLTLIIGGCTFTSTRLNREEDKLDAQKVTNKFFDIVKTGNYAAAHDLFSDKFWKVTSPAHMNDIFTATQKKLGDIVNINLSDWETRVVSGTDPVAEYKLVYKNHHQKFDSVETFGLMKEDDGKIRILSYNINSDGFFK